MRSARSSEEGAAVPPEAAVARTDDLLTGVFAGLFGLLLGLSLVKFGNAVILEEHIGWPGDVYEWCIFGWPPVIGYWLLAGVVVCGLLVVRPRPGIPRWLLFLPLAWYLWQVASGTQSVDRRISHETLLHFTACAACFYLGLFALSPIRRMWPFWAGILVGFMCVLISGFEQHFGGLEQTRKFYYLYYIYPHPDQPVPPDLMKRMATNRIFATLFYPNTLAGVIVMLLPALLAFIGSLERLMTPAARRLLIGVVGGGGLACLYWSGSKGGWLLMLVLIFVGVLFLPFQQRYKTMLVCAVLAIGLAGFFIKYSAFFRKGAPSVVARFDYWRGAVQAVSEKPVLGSGPGTFGVTFKRLKKEDSEMSLMAHNDYLQQASDSGVPGFLAYAGLVVAGLVYAFRRSRLREDRLKLAVWLGLLGWALGSVVEFGLYIPAVAWPALALLGWLVGQGANHSTAARQNG
jgi:O-antigen ligase